MNHLRKHQRVNVPIRIVQTAQFWILIFLVYALALTIATHWPALRIDAPVVYTDKYIHIVAFGILTLLMWKTRWISSVWVLLIIMIVWSILDETTQGIPGLRRTASAIDALANIFGVLLVCASIAMLQSRATRQANQDK